MKQSLKMEKYRIYKSNNKVVNEILSANNIIIVINTFENFIGHIGFKQKINNIDYQIIMVGKNEINLNNALLLANHYIDKLNGKEVNNEILTEMRANLDFDSTIVEMFNMKLHYFSNDEKSKYILFNYFSIKQLMKKYGIKKFYHYYKESCVDHYINYLYNNIHIDMADYFTIVELKYIIQIYKKEVDNTIELKKAKMTSGMLLKYLDNYFSKCILISYDRAKIKEYIHQYYVTDFQSDDNILSFIHNILYLYQELNNVKFRYEIVYNYDYSNKMYKNYLTKFYPKINGELLQKVMLKKDNYKIIMFLFELIDTKHYRSEKKQIIDYISVLELILIHDSSDKDDTISRQFIYKIKAVMKKNGIYSFDKKKLYLIYSYRSKVIHGDYFGIEKVLIQLTKLKPYDLNKKKFYNETYLTKLQLVEEIMLKRVKFIFRKVLLTFFKNNNYIIKLKAKKASELSSH